MVDKSKDQSDANEFESKTQSLIKDPPALPKLSQKNETKNATKPTINSKMVSPKKPASKANVELTKDKIQSVSLKKVNPIKPKAAVKKSVPAKGQLEVSNLVAKTIALAKQK